MGQWAVRYRSVTDQRPPAEPLPQRRPSSPDPDGAPGLPRRTAVSWRVGRHRSPHRLSVASGAPALVLAVPGRGSRVDHDLVERIAEAASQSCPGVDILVGYLSAGPDDYPAGAAGGYPPGTGGQPGAADGLAGAIASAPDHGSPAAPRAVVVPLLAGPHPVFDAEIGTTIGAADPPVMLASHLGPHPLLAGALHDRLSEVGLARASRALGLNIAVGANGVLVVADRGPGALSEAGLTTVLLAARLAVPTAHASLGDDESIRTAVSRLREAGASKIAISPCVIGPESRAAEFEQLSAALGMPCAPPLRDHPAVAQLVAARYGEALARISVPSH